MISKRATGAWLVRYDKTLLIIVVRNGGIVQSAVCVCERA